MINEIVDSDVWYRFDSLLRMYENTFLLQMSLDTWQNYFLSLENNNILKRAFPHWNKFVYDLMYSPNIKTTLRYHIHFCGEVFSFKDNMGNSYHVKRNGDLKTPVSYYKALSIYPSGVVKEERIRYLLYCDVDKSKLLNNNTRLLFKEEQDKSVVGINKLDNNLFCNGLVIGFDSNGIKNCPYTEKSLKFLLECA